jgi:hydroxycarboxylate dehydrogenase B
MSKLDFDGTRVDVDAGILRDLGRNVLREIGCTPETAASVSNHLVETSLAGVESHGVMRLLQYVDQFRSGYMSAGAVPTAMETRSGVWEIDGGGGIGIPAMELAIEKSVLATRQSGLVAVAVRHCGHTGRIGAYVERGADAGCLTICIGGGGRHNWRQVAPYGGSRAILPTNPYALAMPGGNHGPVVLDFATSIIAGGWIYAAKNAGALLPEGCLIDRDGHPSRDPDAYFNGGAILPMGGPKGYALGLIAELIGEAMLGPSTTEMNWLILCLDTKMFKEQSALHATAEEILAEIRTCPPAPGFDLVQVPGERERAAKAKSNAVAIPQPTWNDLQALAQQLGCA